MSEPDRPRSVKGARTVLMSFQRARRLAKKRELGDETERPEIERLPSFILNPHHGYRTTTAVYAEAVARSEDDIIPRLEVAIRNFFYPGNLKDQRISLYFCEHADVQDLDGTAILLYSYLGDLWPQLKYLSMIKSAVYSLLPRTAFKPPSPERRAYLTKLERKCIEVSAQRTSCVGRPVTWAKKEDGIVAVSFVNATRLIDFDNEALLDLVASRPCPRAGHTADWMNAEEIEYFGYMSLLSTFDYSVLREQQTCVPGSNEGHEMFPRRRDARSRWNLLLSKIALGTMRLHDEAPPTWHPYYRHLIVGPLNLGTPQNRALVVRWIDAATRQLLASDKLTLTSQLDLITQGMFVEGPELENDRDVVADALVAAAAAAGYTFPPSYALKKARTYCAFAREVAEREPGFWTLGEEAVLAEHVAHSEGSVDVAELASLIPTRTVLALERRLAAAGGARTLVDLVARAIEVDTNGEDSAEQAKEDENMGELAMGSEEGMMADA